MLNAKTMLDNISKGQSAIPLRYLIAGLEQDFNQLRNQTQLVFIDDSTQAKMKFYFKSPSMSVRGLMYDVVFEFQNVKSKVNSNTFFKVYCNSPSFYFRYANIFRRHNSLLYVEKYPSMVDVSAQIRNSQGATGFDKYVYTALRMSMLKSVEDLKKEMTDNKAPDVESFNKKRFEYLKAKELARTENDGIPG